MGVNCVAVVWWLRTRSHSEPRVTHLTLRRGPEGRAAGRSGHTAAPRSATARLVVALLFRRNPSVGTGRTGVEKKEALVPPAGNRHTTFGAFGALT